VQSITIDEAVFERYRDSADFIEFIFPGGMLPSHERFSRSPACRAGYARPFPLRP
jgi:cyclopropane-fatty-acyl-phospholipid synthase